MRHIDHNVMGPLLGLRRYPACLSIASTWFDQTIASTIHLGPNSPLETAARHAVRIARELEAEAFGPDWLIVVAEHDGPDLMEVTPDGEIRPLPPQQR